MNDRVEEPICAVCGCPGTEEYPIERDELYGWYSHASDFDDGDLRDCVHAARERIEKLEAERDELRAALREAEGIEETLPNYGQQVQIVISAERHAGGGWQPTAMRDNLYPLVIPNFIVHFWRPISRERIALAFSAGETEG